MPLVTSSPDGPPPNPAPSKPTTALPPGSCDSHLHVFGPFDRYPLPEDRRFTPNPAPEPAIRALHARLGIERAVLVHSTGHGMDHAPMLDALAAGEGRYRGVAILGADATQVLVRHYDEAGVCGVRFNFLAHLGGQPDTAAMTRTIRLVEPFGWHVAIHVAGHDLVDHRAFVESIESRVVIDHMARPDLAEGLDGPTVRTLRDLLDTGRVWVKLSGSDRISREGPPWRDAARLARALASHAPERVLWGTDWPHVNIKGEMPDDGALADLVADIAPDQQARRLMMVQNPVEFFGFKE